MLKFALAITIVTAASPVFAAGDCTCRYKGAEVFEGQTACIKTSNGSQMARCEKVLNNTSWKFLDQPCPYAQAQPGQNMTQFDLAVLKPLPKKAN